MKKGISISLSLLMLTAVMHLSVAIHYCGGIEVATRVSVTGKLANCGMGVSYEKTPQGGLNFNTHCCDDLVTFCGTDSNYTPTYLFALDSFQHNFQFLILPPRLSGYSNTDLIPLYTNVYPPGLMMSTNVDLSDICVFRI
jgi:hypothetical protein